MRNLRLIKILFALTVYAAIFIGFCAFVNDKTLTFVVPILASCLVYLICDKEFVKYASRSLPLDFDSEEIEEGFAIRIMFNDDHSFHSSWLFIVKEKTEEMIATIHGLNDAYNQGAASILHSSKYRMNKEVRVGLNEMKYSYLKTLYTYLKDHGEIVGITKFVKDGMILRVEDMDESSFIENKE